MKPYSTIRQFQERLTFIKRSHYQKYLCRDIEPKELIRFNKRIQICERGIKRIMGEAFRTTPQDNSLNMWMDLHSRLVAELMDISTVHESWEFKVMVKQLDTVNGMIQKLQRHGMKLTFVQKVKVFLNRLKRGQFLTLFTNY